MNQPCTICHRLYWETDDLSPNKTFICPDCKRQGFNVKTTATNHTEVLDEQER